MSARHALLVIDMLHDFVHGELKFERAGNVIDDLAGVVAGARESGVPVVYATDAHRPEDHELTVWGEHAMEGSAGAEVIAELAPQPGDHRVLKRTYSAFYDTKLESLLRELDVDTVVITGIHTHICDLHTAADAFYRGFKIDVVSDCVDAFTAEDHRRGLDFLKTMYGARVVEAAQILSEWRQAAA